ncbi:DUF1983 domain-containing protein [Enterobacter kobei]|uniref:phage tail tip fiber protein n=1 Tax=Enterobacter kobei TaxID=208224 RepID=UPI0030765285
MANTYNICEVTVTIPSLGTITTDGAGNKIKRGEKCRVHLYAVKPDWHSGTIFDGFNVGAICFTGYTDSPFKRSQKIMMPDGFKLVALRVDDDGVPTSWESLPVQFSGGLISLNDADGAVRARLGTMNIAEPFSISMDGQIFVTDAKIGDGVLSTTYSVNLNINNNGKEHAAGTAIGVKDCQINVEFMADRYTVHEAASSIIENAVATSAKTKIRLGDEMKQAVIDAVRESDLFASLKANIDAQTASVAGLQQAMHDVVNDALRNALKPGGAIWVQQRGR